MRRLILVVAVGSTLAAVAGSARGQVITSGPAPHRLSASIGLPDQLYGTSWGVASYGLPRTYTAFASSYGGGYGYGYPNNGVLPGRFGEGLWRPGQATPRYAYGSAFGYSTFPYPYKPGGPKYGPPIGVYAPGFGPGQPSPYYSP
jgi:hypothetical protein